MLGQTKTHPQQPSVTNPMNKLIRSLCSSLMIVALMALVAGCGGGGNAKMDTALSDLEKTCEKTASLYQKAKTGDQAAAAEIVKVTQEFQSFSKSVQEAGTMSTEQAKRYQEIMDKYAKSMQ